MHTVREVIRILPDGAWAISGELGREFDNPAPLDDANGLSICFCQAHNDESLIKESKSHIIVCSGLCTSRPDQTLIMVENPRFAFIDIMNEFFPRKTGSIHKTAVIYDNVKIGKNVTIDAGAVIGGEGFGVWRAKGYMTAEDSSLKRMPQLGGVILEDGVSVGGNSCIDRGALGDTIVGEGTQIDNLVHIGHNCKIGKYCVLAAGVILCGSVTLGDFTWAAPGSVIRNQKKVGKNVTIGLGAVVVKDVRDGATVMGVPAREHSNP